jgi:hypothetical protein
MIPLDKFALLFDKHLIDERLQPRTPAQKHMICARLIRYREVPHPLTFT